MDTPKISLRRTFNSLGLSLIEILIVITLLAAMAGFALPRLRLKTATVQTTTRELNQLMRSMRLMAKSRQHTYRIVFDLSEKPHRYWVEKTTRTLEPDFWKKSVEESWSQDPESPPIFEKETTLVKKPKVFAPQVKIVDMETPERRQTSAQNYMALYCFPVGVCEPTLMRLETDQQKSLFLFFDSLTGTVTLYDKKVGLNDFTVD